MNQTTALDFAMSIIGMEQGRFCTMSNCRLQPVRSWPSLAPAAAVRVLCCAPFSGTHPPSSGEIVASNLSINRADPRCGDRLSKTTRYSSSYRPR